MLKEAKHFIEKEKQFHLGGLITEKFHKKTLNLSNVALSDPREALLQLIDVDRDVLRMLKRMSNRKKFEELAGDIEKAVKNGGRIFFAGCGATGRLSILFDSICREFWKKGKYKNRTVSVMSGGDYALIKSVESYEDFAVFGRKQMNDAGVKNGDLVLAITEGGETSFVIGAALAGLEAGALTYFIYNNPDKTLENIERSRKILSEKKIKKMCLATGPMAISGSTRMQCVTAELLAVGIALETALQRLSGRNEQSYKKTVKKFEMLLRQFENPGNVSNIIKASKFESDIYRKEGLVTYVSDKYALDLFTDTTERSPTFLLPPFIKKGDKRSKPSWCYLVKPALSNKEAWKGLLKRDFNDITWSKKELSNMIGKDAFVKRFPDLARSEILKFDISRNALKDRVKEPSAGLVFFIAGDELNRLNSYSDIIKKYKKRISNMAVVFLGTGAQYIKLAGWIKKQKSEINVFKVIINNQNSFLDISGHSAIKLCVNYISVMTMVFMERVYGNCMIWVSPSNKKLYDRATWYTAQVTGSSYASSCDAIFKVLKYLKPSISLGIQVCSPVILASIMLLTGKNVKKAEKYYLRSGEKGESLGRLFLDLRKPAK